MKLKILKTINKKIVNLELETSYFSAEENKMLDMLGEPVVSFYKIYDENLLVEFEKKIRTGFKLKIKFDGTDNIYKADDACNLFLEDVQELLSSTMGEVKGLYDELDGQTENKPAYYLNIEY